MRKSKIRSDKNAGQVRSSNDSLTKLYTSPEFLIRRVHQLASAAFIDSCAELDITPSQYAVLFALRQQQSVSQNELGRLIALDSSTTSVVLKSLRERGFVNAGADVTDKRKTILQLTNQGRLVLAQAEQRSTKASEDLLSALSERKCAQFLSLLQQLATSDLNTTPTGSRK